MRNLLFVLPSLDYCSLARQATITASHLPTDRFAVRLLSLQGAGPLRTAPAQQEIPCFTPEKVRWGNWETIRLLRHLLREEPPDVIHCWGFEALCGWWWATLGQRRRCPPIVVSLPLSGMSRRGFGWWTRRLLRHASVTVAANDHARKLALGQGVPPERVRVIPPGVEIPPTTINDPRPSLGLPAGARTIVSIGSMDSSQRVIEFFWASAILNVADPDVYLVGIGSGPARERFEVVTRRVMRDPVKLWLPGSRDQATELLPTAEMVWVVPRQAGGTYAVLEGMAAGRAVVATNLPHLSALMTNGETGCLVPPREPTTIARVSAQLIREESRRIRLGEAARAAIRDHGNAAAMAARFAELYDLVSR